MKVRVSLSKKGEIPLPSSKTTMTAGTVRILRKPSFSPNPSGRTTLTKKVCPAGTCGVENTTYNSYRSRFDGEVAKRKDHQMLLDTIYVRGYNCRNTSSMKIQSFLIRTLLKLGMRRANQNVIPNVDAECCCVVTPAVTKVSAVSRTLDQFGISYRAGAAIVSAALQDVGIISESNFSNIVDRNKIRREKAKARTTLFSQSVIKDYDHDQFGLYFDGRKDRTLSMEDNRRKFIIEEHVNLVKEPGSEYIDHVPVNFGRA
ncbi:hypothetical protein AVEN_122244-1 [Araneus ventricosus]|uniref:Uncharacterized protein n=1 Tax=Araneus ventricosus TaxID=182803 RepID=A0A4Y2H9C4_ARAVE|nr:hypothetical protein AVEN_122244-1 [Araneus ventricosus]